MRTGTGAVEAKRAIQVSSFAREVKFRLTSPLLLIATQAIVGLAARADLRLPDFYFERRNQRRDELELTDRTNVFAETCPPKESVQNKRRHEIAQNEPRRPNRLVPQAEGFVGPEENNEQTDSQPF